MTAALAIAGLMTAVWALTVLRRNAGLVDVFWGPGFVLVAIVTFATGDGWAVRRLAVLIAVAVWGLRLGAHLFARNWRAPEDYRYAAMRRRWGRAFPLVSVVTVFALQGAVMWVVSLPVQIVQADGGAAGPAPADVVGLGLFTAGFLFETIGDAQLRRFRAERGGDGGVMDQGLWRYTRHPNYFGDALLWWGIAVVAVSSGSRYRWFALVGPAVMTVFLRYVSGVPMLERRLGRKPGYAAYASRTSTFVPLPPRSR